MKLKVKNGIIYNMEDNTIIGTLSTDSDEAERVIECGSEVLPIVEKFVEDQNNGTFKPRATMKQFELLLEKYAV